MTAYIIKGKYIDSGREYYLDRDGYVVVNIQYLRKHECYTERGAKQVATKKTKADAEQAAYYDRCNAERVRNGKEPFNYAFNQCVYEAFAIEITD